MIADRDDLEWKAWPVVLVKGNNKFRFRNLVMGFSVMMK